MTSRGSVDVLAVIKLGIVLCAHSQTCLFLKISLRE